MKKIAIAAVGVATLAKGRDRLALSRAKHASLTGHPRMANRLARLLPFYDYDERRFFRVDNAPADVVARREAAFAALSEDWKARFARSIALTAETREGLSDLQFTASYRVPFQFSSVMRKYLPSGAFVESSDGVTVTDMDGNRLIDLTGSYGVNLLGYDAYKALIGQAVGDAGALGPVLGQFHPLLADTVARLRQVSRLDEVSFHMSGTEAVMQAVRLARYHTKKPRLVRFCGAYHGWWGDVQPGPGNPTPADRTLTLQDMSDRALGVLDRRSDVACVLVNPLQALHPNGAAPSDGTLVGARTLEPVSREAYAKWLGKLREVCTRRGIVLILDEVFTGFRLSRGGARDYFGVEPDLITYGKTLGGGFPVGILCGRAELMKRFRSDRPADICFARGTFNAHPYVVAAINAFLRHFETAPVRALYDGLDERWDGRAAALNTRLAEAGLPVRIANLSTIWTTEFTAASRYNWMLQYYLRSEGLALSWVGTGRFIFSLNFGDAEFAAVADRFVRAAERMQADGWFWADAAATTKRVRRAILKESFLNR